MQDFLNKPHIIITFKTTTQAMKAENVLKVADVKGRIIPVPATISAGCGMCWFSDISQKARILEALSNNNVEIEAVHEKQ